MTGLILCFCPTFFTSLLPLNHPVNLPTLWSRPAVHVMLDVQVFDTLHVILAFVSSSVKWFNDYLFVFNCLCCHRNRWSKKKERTKNKDIWSKRNLIKTKQKNKSTWVFSCGSWSIEKAASSQARHLDLSVFEAMATCCIAPVASLVCPHAAHAGGRAHGRGLQT